MFKPANFSYPKIVEYSNPSDLNFDNLKQITKHYPVFLSSRFFGMEHFRKIVAKKFEEYGYPVMGWEVGENFGSTQKRQPRNVYLDSLKKSKIYCGILDISYGPEIIENCSATEDEYNHAIKWNHELCLLISNNSPKEDKLNRLINAWKSSHTISIFENPASIEIAVECFIKNHLLQSGLNWIMLGDLILSSGYRSTTSALSINFSTTNISVIEYLQLLNSGSSLGFIDLAEGRRQEVVVEEISIEKKASRLWSIEAQLLKKTHTPRISWNDWSQLTDIGVTVDGDLAIDSGDMVLVSGRSRVPQIIKTYLNCNRGEWVLRPQFGSNLHSILSTYSGSPDLAELLIKFDVIESLTYQSGSESRLPIPCLDHILVSKVSNINSMSVDLEINLFMKDLSSPIVHTAKIQWNGER